MFEDGKISSEIDYSSLNSLCEIFETLDINSLNTFVIDDINNLPNKIVDPDHIINLQRCKNYKSSILLIYRDKPNIRRYKNYLNSSCSSTFSKNIHCKENYNLYTGEK
ncbi:hypothetical protein H8356DRAFT_1347205 [Neocallimastix lanati (nom. inval.)]|nr:hypothetical protein H8356DRAFT_1347205 [Neocallimastix sp. JGI-2020a]